MSMTPFSDEFVGVKAIRFYPTTSSVVMGNFTIQIEAPNIINSGNANNMNVLAARTTLAHDIQRHLTGVIHRRHNNVGDSAIWVDSPNGAVSPLEGKTNFNFMYIYIGGVPDGFSNIKKKLN